MGKTKPEIEFPGPSPELKAYMVAEELRRKNAHFGKFFYWIIDTGILAILRPKGAKVLLLLIRYAHFVTGIGRVGNEKISRKGWIHNVSGYFKDLELLGIIKTWRRGWARYYQIQSSPPPDIQKRIENFRKLHQLDMYPKKTDSYPRDPKTGRFAEKRLPKNTEVAYPKNTEVA